MLKSFLQLNINQPHNKSQYSIKKNKIILLPNKTFNNISINRYNKAQDNIISKLANNNNNNTNNKSNINIQNNSQQNKILASSTSKSRFNTTNNTINKLSNDNQFQYKLLQSNNLNNNIYNNTKLSHQVKFDCITYDYKSTNQKLLYDFLMLKPSINKQSSLFDLDFPNLQDNIFNTNINQSPLSSVPQGSQTISMTITFNYDIEYEKLQQLLIQLMTIKKFQESKFKIAHFELRNNHISDYNKSIATNDKKKKQRSPDQMDIFTKQIDTCIKLDKTYKIMQNINFKQFTLKDYKQKDILNKNSRTNYDKKTNQFFICDIDQGKYSLNIILLHRQKDYILTKTQDKQIQQAFVLLKNAVSSNNSQKINLQFTTSLVQIIQSYILSSDQVIFVSQYPTLNNSCSLKQLLRIPIKIQQNRPQQVEKIILEYNKQKETKLQTQMQKMRTKLRQLTHKKKTTEQNICYLNKKYKKGFENIFDSLTYLKSHNITDLGAFKQNLMNQIGQKQQDIRDTLQRLKQINYQIIMSQQRNEYFKQKMQILKQNLTQDLQDIDYSSVNKSKSSSTILKGNNNVISNNNNINNNNSNSNRSNNKNTKINNSNNNNISKTNNIDSGQKSTISPKSINDNQLTQTILKKFLQVQDLNQNPFSVQLKRQTQKYSNQLRQKTRQRLIKSKQIDQFHNLMDQLRKRLSKSEFTKLQQKYLGLISMS